MNPQTTLRYPHSAHPPLLRDMRKQHDVEINLDHCYFMGFRISTDTDSRYHHSLLLADDYDSLLQGIKTTLNTLLEKQCHYFDCDVALIFLRSLKIQSAAIAHSRQGHKMETEMQNMLSRRDDHKFAVFGMFDDGVFLEQTYARDALAAIELAYSRCPKESQKEFLPLEICQAHPVTKEFDSLFLLVAHQLKRLIGASLSEGEYWH